MIGLLLALGSIAIAKWVTDPRVDGSAVTMHECRELDSLSRCIVTKHGVRRASLPPDDWTFPPGSVGALLQEQRRNTMN